MNKKIFIVILCLVLFIIIISFVNRNLMIKNIERMEEIRNDVKKEALSYINIIAPSSSNNGKEVWISDKELTDLNKRGVDKSILLLYNKKDYCSSIIHGVSNGDKWDIDVYLKCNIKVLFKNVKYSDKEYYDNVEYYKCVTLTGGTNTTKYKDFTCPSDKKEYVLKNYAFYTYLDKE